MSTPNQTDVEDAMVAGEVDTPVGPSIVDNDGNTIKTSNVDPSLTPGVKQ
jgi:hypothetical protein